MDLLENKDTTPPRQFTELLETLNSQFPAVLIDFKKYYVFLNKNPDYPEYQNMFQNIKSNLNTINSQLFTLSNDVQHTTDDINEQLFILDSSIKKERKINKELKKKLGIVEHKNNAATELISDYKNMYESVYLRNWALLLSTLVVGFAIAKVYNGQQLA
jgi:hypothetical protein